VYGYSTLNPADAVVYISVNGVDVASVTGLPGSEALILDVYADLEPNTSVTINIDVASSTAGVNVTVYITKVYVIAGYALTSTTLTDIITVTLDPSNDIYTIKVNGNFTYKVGVRWWAKGNRKTTDTATITSTLSGEKAELSSLGAGDDGDGEVFLLIASGDYATSFTVRGSVGASGDTVIITGVYCQVMLVPVGVNTLVINERGVLYCAVRMLSITGRSMAVGFSIGSLDAPKGFLSSPSGTDVRWVFESPVWDVQPCYLALGYPAEGYTQILMAVVIGE
jgi:hypothetical protein